jgi:hypothetical protein
MIYTTEIRLFNEWLETHQISTSAIVLWHTLLYVAFRGGWQPEFNAPVSLIMLRTGLGRSAVYKERKVLRDVGLIDFDVGEGSKSNTYRIIGFETRSVSTDPSATRTESRTENEQSPKVSTNESATRTESETQRQNETEVSTNQSTTRTDSWTENEKTQELSTDESATRTESWTPTEPPDGKICDKSLSKSDLSDENDDCRNLSQSEHDPYISIYKERDKKDNGGIRGKKKSGGFDLSFIGDEVWEGLVESWLEYKRSRSENYKSELSVKKFHTMLRNLSRGDSQVARQIIDKSIANNWAGIFELAPDDGKSRNQSAARPSTGQRIGQIKQPEDEERRRKLLEKFDKKK